MSELGLGRVKTPMFNLRVEIPSRSRSIGPSTGLAFADSALMQFLSSSCRFSVLRRTIMRHLNQVELGRRWNVSPRTLENQRWKRRGPAYLKLEGRVVYRLKDVEEYERAHEHLTADALKRT
jgi:hypothetical protein